MNASQEFSFLTQTPDIRGELAWRVRLLYRGRLKLLPDYDGEDQWRAAVGATIGIAHARGAWARYAAPTEKVARLIALL